jgi:hypothetical protein
MSSFSSINVDLPPIEKPTGEMRSLKKLQDYINTLDKHGVDSLHTSDEVTLDDFNLSIALCKAQADARYNRTVGTGKERVYLGWPHYTDQERVALKKKLCGAYEEWQRFRNCWPLDVIMTRIINNKRQARGVKRRVTKAQLELQRLKRLEKKRDAAIASVRRTDTRTAMKAEGKEHDEDL